MKSHLTVLFSSAGRRVELLNCFREDARELGLVLHVLAVDCDPTMSSACQVADHSLAVPRCTDASFIPRLLEICAAERVDLVIPTIDTELLPLAEARHEFETIGTRVAVSDLETVAMARDKLRTATFLERHGVASPRTVPATTLLEKPDALQFPVILKKIDGSSSIGLKEAAGIDEVRDPQLDLTRYIAQEKWIGREYTVNLFFDDAGHCRAAVPHLRCEIRAGEVSKGVTLRHPLLKDFAARLAEALPGARGALCFQSIITAEGRGVVFEINARFGGGYPLAHSSGARFSRWFLEPLAGLTSSANDNWLEGVTMLRYDAAVFVGAPLK
jgi:carbamoyl-phosphate synthase large subunit